jgi:hypothetical protein
MTIPNNTPTRSATNAHKGQTVADTNQLNKYEVMLILAQRSSGSVIIEASSPEEARQKAEEISEVFNWEIYEDEITVESVEPASEGQSND